MSAENNTSDRWMRRLEEAAPASAEPGEGRVLRLKLGYNPNSSSVGSVVTTLLWSATAGAAALNIAAALIRERAGQKAQRDTSETSTAGDET